MDLLGDFERDIANPEWNILTKQYRLFLFNIMWKENYLLIIIKEKNFLKIYVLETYLE